MKDKWDLNFLEEKLNKIEKDINKSNKSFKDLIINIAEKDESKVSHTLLFEELNEDEKDYFLKNEAYKKYISQYSKEYIEMSELYYGPELPYDIYIKEFRKEKETYLDNKESIKELYSLFMFYGLLQYYLPTI
tara:strand:+ start:3094 stop:3492 length:399 start_codon:yes stop_codon:yes gene_type:complete